jgi:molybdenum cofactor synthesis domain-containing protein
MTVGIIVIGNEVLSGKVVDTNSPYFCQEFRTLGVDVREISVVPDEVPVISQKVSDFSNRFDFVFTSGGVGPTHDDVTIEGIANAFRVKIVRNSDLAKILNRWYGEDLNDARLKMAEVPDGSRLLGQERLTFPLVMFRNVYIFPGIPEILREKFEAVKETFRGSPFFLKIVYVRTQEGNLAEYMNQLVVEFPGLLLGSYPVLHNPEYRVKVTMESKEKDYLEKAAHRFLKALPEDFVVRVE